MGKKDMNNSILSRIYTKKENIEGMLQNLEYIMDRNSYCKLNERYLKIQKDIPRDVILDELDKEYGNFALDAKYIDVEKRLDVFLKEISKYNVYKEMSSLLETVKGISNKSFIEKIDLDEYVNRNKELVDCLISVKENETMHQFTGLLDDVIKNIFSSLKVLDVFGNGELLTYVDEKESDYLREFLSREVRNSIDVTNYCGDLDTDYVDFNTIHQCAIRDRSIINRQNEARIYKEEQERIALEEAREFENVKNELEIGKQRIKEQNSYIKNLKITNNLLRLKGGLLRFALVPALAIPVACPIIGGIKGRAESDKVLLTKAITRTVDADSLEVIGEFEEYRELTTSYIASVTICEPWERNITGVSYSRDCTVYDYSLDNVTVTDDFSLRLDNINYDNLVEKYTYEKSTTDVIDEKYLTEQQIYITETFNTEETIASSKYVAPFIAIGLGIGIGIGTLEVLLYKMFGDMIMDIDAGVYRELEANVRLLDEYNRNLKELEDRNSKLNERYKALSKKR